MNFFAIARTTSWFNGVAWLRLLAITVLNEHISNNTSGKLVMGIIMVMFIE